MRLSMILIVAIGLAGAVAAQAADGKKVYDGACAMCHKAGTAGAPKLGDRDAWAPRIEQGMEILYERSIMGFKGSKGTMPARGGRSSLSDDEVRAAVDYMVAQSGGE